MRFIQSATGQWFNVEHIVEIGVSKYATYQWRVYAEMINNPGIAVTLEISEDTDEEGREEMHHAEDDILLFLTAEPLLRRYSHTYIRNCNEEKGRRLLELAQSDMVLR